MTAKLKSQVFNAPINLCMTLTWSWQVLSNSGYSVANFFSLAVFDFRYSEEGGTDFFPYSERSFRVVGRTSLLLFCWNLGQIFSVHLKRSKNLKIASQEQLVCCARPPPRPVEVSHCCPSIKSQTKLEAGVAPEQKTEWALCVWNIYPLQQLICNQKAWKEPKAWRQPQQDLHQNTQPPPAAVLMKISSSLGVWDAPNPRF